MTVLAQLDLEADEISALGGTVTVPESESGQVEIAVFGLSAGYVVALVRVAGNPSPGFGLLQMDGVGEGSALESFLTESRLPEERITWVPSQAEGRTP